MAKIVAGSLADLVSGFSGSRDWGLKHGKRYGELEAKNPAVKKDFDVLVNQLKKYKKETPLILYPEKARLQMQINALNRGREIGLKKEKKKLKQKKYWK